MHRNINVRLRALDTHGNINRDTKHIGEYILPYLTIQRPRDKQKPITTYWPNPTPRDDQRALT